MAGSTATGDSATMGHGGQLAAKALKAAGVECVFTLSGGHVMGIYDGCLDEGIQVIDVRHEQAATHAADAWARLNPGKIGVAILTAGPGVTDGVTGVANAWRANSPILVFGGQGPFNNLRRSSLREMDHVALMKPITKWAGACYETKRIGEYIELAIRNAMSGVPGPAFLEIPMDVLHGPVDLATPLPVFRDYRVAASAADDALDQAAAILAAARQPMIMAGTALKWSEGGPRLRSFVESTQMPCFTNGMGRGQLPMSHPQYFNRSRKQALAESDVVVLAGTTLDFRMKFGASIPAGTKIIQLDLDETLIGQNRSADVGLVGNLGANLAALEERLTKRGGVDFAEWSATLRAAEVEAEAALALQLTSDEVPIDPLRLCSEIASFVDTDDSMIVIGDGGDIVAQASKVLRVPENGTWMDPGPLGTLGVGMPFALAAQLACPDQRVLIIYGDGSFGLNGFEFDTAVRFGLPIVGIVGNDAAWGQMMRPQAMIYGQDRLVATELAPTRYDLVVEALGGHGECVTEPDQIRPALERAFASGKPALVNVMKRTDVGAPKGSTSV
ncbi:MAG: thiamine pyrophosphate-binding protein [Acidimicrobiales bacterium]